MEKSLANPSSPTS